MGKTDKTITEYVQSNITLQNSPTHPLWCRFSPNKTFSTAEHMCMCNGAQLFNP